MLYNLQSHLSELKDSPEKAEKYSKYNTLVEPLSTLKSVRDFKWYDDYISLFTPKKFRRPEELENDFDWDLLCQLVSGSFSSSSIFESINTPPGLELVITVFSGEITSVRKMSELWGFQILKLFNIYVEEQMNLEVLIAEDIDEKVAILKQRQIVKNRWDVNIKNIDNENLFGKYNL